MAQPSLVGEAYPLLAPWICGAYLMALVKLNNQGYHLMAVGDIFP